MLETLLRAIVLAMRERSQLDGAAHVARIVRRCSQLIQALMAPLDDRRGDQRHAAADQVHGDHVQAFALV